MNRGSAGDGRSARRLRRAPALLFALLAGCGTTEFEAQPVIPPPLITRIPVVVGVYLPAEFRTAVHREEHDGGGQDREPHHWRDTWIANTRPIGLAFSRSDPSVAAGSR